MAERIIMCVCFFMCALPFMIIGLYSKESATPIPFWSGGEDKLKQQLKDIKHYNCEMALLYRKCAIAFLVAGIGACVYPAIGLVVLGLNLTVGVFFFYKNHRQILNRYS